MWTLKLFAVILWYWQNTEISLWYAQTERTIIFSDIVGFYDMTHCQHSEMMDDLVISMGLLALTCPQLYSRDVDIPD